MTPKESRALVGRMNHVSSRFEFRAGSAKDESGPGYVIERRPKDGAGQWSFVGWAEDIRTPKDGVFLCYGETVT